MENITLSDVMQKQIKRTGNIAEIIWDYEEGHPIRLIGFSTKASLTDLEIFEEGLAYYNELFNQVQIIKNGE